MKRALGTSLCFVLLAAGWLGALAPRAEAHAAYKDSDPPNRASVSSPPSSVWAEFTEPVTEDSRLEIYDPCGGLVSGGSSATGYRITTSMSADKAGTYRVAFAVQSSLDGHHTRGEFTFTSTGGAPCPGSGGGSGGTGGSGGGSGDQVTGSARRGSTSGGGTTMAAGGSGGAGPAQTGRGERRSARDRNRAAGRRSEGPAARGPARRGPDGSLIRAQEGNEAPAGDIPLNWLLIGFAISALIGAAAGSVYASIVGPEEDP